MFRLANYSTATGCSNSRGLKDLVTLKVENFASTKFRGFRGFRGHRGNLIPACPCVRFLMFRLANYSTATACSNSRGLKTWLLISTGTEVKTFLLLFLDHSMLL